MFRVEMCNGVSKLYLNECRNDLWIREIVFPGRTGGYFVEAGAGNGVAGSSCYLLEKQYGWRGLCIEPNDRQFSELVRARPNSIAVNVCLAAGSGLVNFAVASNGLNPYLSGVREMLAVKSQGGYVLENSELVVKPAAALADLLRVHDAPRQIEYGAFDIEGSEFEAMRLFPFDEYRFLALSFEVGHPTRQPLAALLAAHGYRETQNPFNRDCPWERYWLHESIADGVPE
jgi:hypothetical protein